MRSSGTLRHTLRRPLLLLALVALTLPGCGGSDFEGEADVPDDYATYRGNGVTFVHPAAWKPATRDLGRGITEVRFQDPAAGESAAAVSLTIQADVGDRFDALLDSEREVLETTTGAEVSRDEVELPGARKAYRSTIETDSASSEVVDVLAPDGRHLALAAGAPDGQDDELDVDAVVSSLRLEGT
jgi:ABC-type glycerol-3-phosphate transport system substrate-binding protein